MQSTSAYALGRPLGLRNRSQHWKLPKQEMATCKAKQESVDLRSTGFKKPLCLENL